MTDLKLTIFPGTLYLKANQTSFSEIKLKEKLKLAMKEDLS